MKYLLIATALCLVSLHSYAMGATARTGSEPFPSGCGGLFNKCEGWMCYYPGTDKDKDGNLTHLDDINHFVSNKEASNMSDACKIADGRVLKTNPKP